MHWFSFVCTRGVGRSIPNRTSDGRDQPFMSITDTKFRVRSSEFGAPNQNTPNSELITLKDEEENMPRRERDRELARRRKRREKRKKLRAKGLLASPVGTVKEDEKKKPEKAPSKETSQEDKNTPSEG